MSENKKGFVGLFIPAEVWEKQDLPVAVRVLYAEIHALARGAQEQGRPGCYKSTARFAAEYGVSERTVKTWIKKLKDRRLVRQVGFDGRSRYLDVCPAAREETSQAGGEETSQAAREKSSLQKEKSKEKSKEKVRETADAVIDYLNKKAGKHYRHTATNRRLVNARLKEEFTVDDCRTVIDNQVADWRDDQKMNEYLRPSTLFAPTKFEGYLNRKAPRTATRPKLCPKCGAQMIGTLCMACAYEEPVVW